MYRQAKFCRNYIVPIAELPTSRQPLPSHLRGGVPARRGGVLHPRPLFITHFPHRAATPLPSKGKGYGKGYG